VLTRKEAATVVAALLYFRNNGVEVVTHVRVPPSLNVEVPLSKDEVDALVVRLVAGEAQEGESIL
jgi:hypothetical protein